MGFRFRRSIRIAPGVRVNLGLSGASLSVGRRGASVTVGKRGTYANVGVPGTGLSFRERLDQGGPSKREQQRFERLAASHAKAEAHDAARRKQIEALSNIKLTLDDTSGDLTAVDANGQPIAPQFMKLLWEQQGVAVLSWLEEQADRINGDMDALLNIHHCAPSPSSEPVYTPVPYGEPEPKRPSPPKIPARPSPPKTPRLGWFARLFPSRRQAHEAHIEALTQEHARSIERWQESAKTHEAKHQHAIAAWEAQIKEWQDKQAAHDANERRKAERFPDQLRSDVELMEQMLEQALAEVIWPRETLVSFSIADQGASVWLDVDLPEIEDLPSRTAEVAANGRKLKIKDKSQTSLRVEYASHVHAVGLIAAATTFAAVPSASTVVVSGFSQRLNKATGAIDDDYLFSFLATREQIERIDFEALEAVDPIEALTLFDLRRTMTKTGVFRPVVPFELPQQATVVQEI